MALGLAGVRYAPAIVAAQHRQGMTPVEDDAISGTDRIRVTKGTGLVVASLGVVLLAYWL
ncbi:hypothetical protein [Natrarchaeobius halalkaliphilus]|uniref:hypothetical protein n=1 Tax=Natrarchaeobius halalkaliphilus TaxID=1679091 RepID=UPI001FB4C8B2|nr:hypothetical protein [Natrarchaeobius halalkaliphilus]